MLPQTPVRREILCMHKIIRRTQRIVIRFLYGVNKLSDRLLLVDKGFEIERKVKCERIFFNVLWATVKFQLIEPEEICWSLFGTLSNTEIIANRN